MKYANAKSRHGMVMNSIAKLANVLVLISSIVIIVTLSIELLSPFSADYRRMYMNLQLWVCVIFLVDFFLRLYMSDNRRIFFMNNVWFLLVSIPYANIVGWLHLQLNDQWYYIIKVMPLIRGGYGIVIFVSWLTRNKVKNLLTSYLIILFSFIYFSIIVFYGSERGVNPGVSTIGDSVWWAFMNVTTVGAKVFAVTTVGKVLSVALAAAGMMMFPIFTVYVTDVIQSYNSKKNGKNKTSSEDYNVESGK